MRRSSLYEDGIRLYDQGRFAEAIAAFESVVRETPRGDLNERLAHFYLGEAHTALADSPGELNEDPYEDGWLIKIRMSRPDEAEELLSPTQYEDLVDDA